MSIVTNLVDGNSEGIVSGVVSKDGVNPIAGNLIYSLPLNGGLGSSGTDPTLTRAASATYIDTDRVLQSVGSNVARFESGGLLFEGQDTNHVLRSNEFDHTAWTALSANISIAGGYPDPFGGNTAWKLTSTSTDLSASVIAQVAATGMKSCAIWFKLGEQNNGFSISHGYGSDTYAENSVSGWNKASFENKTADTGFVIALNKLGLFGENSEGDVVYVCNAQGSTLDIVGSYLETEGTTITRGAADKMTVASGIMPSKLSDQTIAMNIGPLGIASGSQLVWRAEGDASNKRRLIYTSGGIFQYYFGSNLISSGVVSGGLTSSLVIASDGVDFEFFLNGVSLGEAVIAGSTDDASSMNFNFASSFFGHISSIKIYDKRLSASEVAYV